jgi:DNA-binding CsgD family transcriptional regulator/tetratricopeptide (TPR) repeat protein
MLIERDGPLETLHGAAARAAEGRGGILILGREAGIGKTSLLREFARRVGKRHRVLWGGCEALFTPRPLGPLQDMARDLDPQVAELLEQAAAPRRLLPVLLSALQDASDTSVLIFEDVHWADHATLDLVKYLGRRIPLLRALLVLSVRSDEIGPDHPLAQVFGDLPVEATTRLSLPPLSPEAIASLARQAGHSGVDLHRITAGNPFFVTELLAGSEAAPGRIPVSVRDAVWARLARRPAREREVLEIMSIVPDSVEPWLIRALLGSGADGAAGNCVARGLLVRDAQGALTFRHELARLATLERLTPSEQQSLHGRIEAAMSSATAPPDVSLSRRVHHAAGADDAARVLELAPRAATHAARLGAHQEAAAHLETALRYVAQAPKAVAAQLHEDWAYEAGLALRIDESVIAARQRAVALWRELGRLDKVGLNLRWLSRLHWYRGEARQAGDYADEAVRELERLPPGRELAMAYSARSQMHMLHDRTDEAIAWGQRAIALADQVGDVETRVHALNNVGTALLLSGRPGGREPMEESLALALKHGFHEHAARVYTNYAEYAVLFKEFALAERILAEGIAFDTRHDLDAWTHYLVGRQAQLRMEQGRLREAETIASGVMRLKRLTLVMHLPALTVLGRVRVRLGEPDGVAMLQQALKDALATGEPQYIFPARLALAEAAWLADDLAACQTQLEQLAAMPLDTSDPWELGELATWWRRSGMTLPFPEPTARLAAPRAAELRGDPLAAAAEWTQLGLPYEAALALTQVSGTEAGPTLARTVAMLEAIEARAAAKLVRRLAQRLGVAAQLPKARRGPYANARAHPLGLTPRELEVLDLIARGLANKEIARRLTRSPRTVEHQVSAVLAKLNAASRMEVVLRLRSEPWLLSPAAPRLEQEI